jgi:hypothetical protein
MIARTRHQDVWVLSLYRTMQAAIGEQLKKELEPPEDLTPELAVLANRMEKPKDKGRFY